MREQFFGLKKETINKLFKKLEQEFDFEKNELERELEIITKENDNLIYKLKEIVEKQQKILSEQEYRELGKDRISHVIESLSMQKKLELTSLQNDFNERMEHTTQKLNEIEDKIIKNEKILSDLQSKVSDIVNRALMDLTNEDHIQSDTYEEQEQLTSEESSEIIINEGISNNGDENADDFWGDIEDWTLDTAASTEINTEELIPNFEVEFLQNDDGVNVSKDTKLATNQNNSVYTVNIDSVLVEQIDSIKSMYIVGKLAGENLYDQQGNLIVEKFSLITKEVVEKANQAGKLADLIVNMKFTRPGVG
ncbi:MAG: hypothetical protein K0S51_861 [Bacillales bacterium]|jgi:hypothetical protein|nr:hypothetical protein [Bacillales bacterium]